MAYINQQHSANYSSFNNQNELIGQQNTNNYDQITLEQKKQMLRDKLKQQRPVTNMAAVFSGDPFTKAAMKNSMPLEDNLKRLQEELHKPIELLRQERPKDQYIYEMSSFSPLKINQSKQDQNVIEPDSLIKNKQMSEDKQREIDELLDHLRRSEHQENENSEVDLMRISQLLKDKSSGANMNNSGITGQHNVMQTSGYGQEKSSINQLSQHSQINAQNQIASPLFTNQSEHISYPINTVTKRVDVQQNPALNLNVFQTHQQQQYEESSEYPQQELYVRLQNSQQNQFQRVFFTQSKVNKSVSQHPQPGIAIPQRELIQKPAVSQNKVQKTLTVSKQKSQKLQSSQQAQANTVDDTSKNNAQIDEPLNEKLSQSQSIPRPHARIPYLGQLQPSEQRKLLGLITSRDSQIRTFGQPGAPLTVQIDYLDDARGKRDEKEAFNGKVLRRALFQLRPEQVPAGGRVRARDSQAIAQFLIDKEKEAQRAAQALFGALRGKDEVEIKTLTWLNREIARLLRQRCKIMRLEAQKTARNLRAAAAATATALNEAELVDQALRLPVQSLEPPRGAPNNEQIIQILSTRLLVEKVEKQVRGVGEEVNGFEVEQGVGGSVGVATLAGVPGSVASHGGSHAVSAASSAPSVSKPAGLLQSLLQADLSVETKVSKTQTAKSTNNCLSDDEDLAKFVKNDYLRAPQSHVSLGAYVGALNVALINYARVSSAARFFLLFYDEQVKSYEVYRQICGIESQVESFSEASGGISGPSMSAFARYRNSRALTAAEFAEIRASQSQVLPVVLLTLELLWSGCAVRRVPVPASVLSQVKKELQQVLGPAQARKVALPGLLECRAIGLQAQSAAVGNLLVQCFSDFAARFRLLRPRAAYPACACARFVLAELRGFPIWAPAGNGDHEADLFCFLEALARVLAAVFAEIRAELAVQ